MPLVSLTTLAFHFNSCAYGLDILHGRNAFGHTTLKNNFFIVDLDDCYNNLSSIFVLYFYSNFESIKWHNGMLYLHVLAKKE